MTFPKTTGAINYFPIANMLGHVSVTKIRVHSLIDVENLRRTTLYRTDIYRNLSLGAPDSICQENYSIFCISFTELSICHFFSLLSQKSLLIHYL